MDLLSQLMPGGMDGPAPVDDKAMLEQMSPPPDETPKAGASESKSGGGLSPDFFNTGSLGGILDLAAKMGIHADFSKFPESKNIDYRDMGPDQPTLDELINQINALTPQAKAAHKSQDQTEIDKVNEAYMPLAKRYNALLDYENAARDVYHRMGKELWQGKVPPNSLAIDGGIYSITPRKPLND